DAEVLDVAGRVVVPGLVNAHTHSNQTLEAALCDRLPLDAWMVLASYGGAGGGLFPPGLPVPAPLRWGELLETRGTAPGARARASRSAFDQGVDAIAQAYADVGMRAAVAAQYTDLDYFSSIPLWLVGRSYPMAERSSVADVLGPATAFVRRWQGRSALVQPYLGPSSLPRCSVELFEASVDAARALGCGLQTHLLSARSPVEVGTRRYGGAPRAFLDR